ncbi:hypothetical protein [Vibrio tapetis]|uniref:Uncharacterized protein n=1 Tax=Vibrio tapetis subsp. tapetis TaxID=1671868 RepID=A0A2N8ZJL4_9VIBR|nr:hypothetical protein [Vibrio tapetis]SON52110.1 protein of unknown function [Vibrio tapetis subsp. tapetis]
MHVFSPVMVGSRIITRVNAKKVSQIAQSMGLIMISDYETDSITTILGYQKAREPMKWTGQNKKKINEEKNK